MPLGVQAGLARLHHRGLMPLTRRPVHQKVRALPAWHDTLHWSRLTGASTIPPDPSPPGCELPRRDGNAAAIRRRRCGGRRDGSIFRSEPAWEGFSGHRPQSNKISHGAQSTTHHRMHWLQDVGERSSIDGGRQHQNSIPFTAFGEQRIAIAIRASRSPRGGALSDIFSRPCYRGGARSGHRDPSAPWRHASGWPRAEPDPPARTRLPEN